MMREWLEDRIRLNGGGRPTNIFPLNPSISPSRRRIKRPRKPLHLEPKNSYEDHSFCLAVAREEEPNGFGLEERPYYNLSHLVDSLA